jgi:hypothetical protein
MIKLNGEDVQKAWEDYKGFLEGMGVNPDLRMQQAFKFGFAAGKTNKLEPTKTPIPFDEPKQPQTIKQRTITKRTEKEMDQDAKLVASILQRNNGPMALKDILIAVNAAGADWYSKSATNHMNKVMEKQPCVKKASYGFYEYVQ